MPRLSSAAIFWRCDRLVSRAKKMSTPYIIISDSEDEFENSSTIIPVPPSPDYTPMSNSETKPFEHELDDSSEGEEEPLSA
ncbi:hypothetical protein Tco_0276258 [Tanacetum coccineum]